MGKCAACGTFILFGGVREGDRQYCNETCHANGQIGAVKEVVPFDLVAEETWAVYGGACPECGGAGPVEFHQSHKILSFLVLTRWSSHPHVCCRSCARKHQLGAIAASAVGGWWGFPWGILGTPIQIGRNAVAMLKGTETTPSADLQEYVHTVLAIRAQEALIAAPSGGAMAPPPLPQQARG